MANSYRVNGNQDERPAGSGRLPFAREIRRPAQFQHPTYPEKAKISSPDATYEILKGYSMAGNEFFLSIYLGSKNNILDIVISAEGTVDQAAVLPREIIKGALLVGAAALVVVHNHPAGNPEPSQQDHEITKEIQFGARFLGLRLLDHVIVGRPGPGRQAWYSMATSGSSTWDAPMTVPPWLR